MKNNYSFGFFNWFYQYLIQLSMSVYCLFRYSIVIEGKENIPDTKEQNYIVVANHLKYDDISLLAKIFGAGTCFVAKKELFENPLMGFFLTNSGTICVDREKPQTSVIKAVKKALSKDGWRVAIFIEGTRSKIEGQLGKPNTGPIFMAQLAKATILPVGIFYKSKKDVVVRIGKEYSVSKEANLEEETWRCLEKVSKLSGYAMPPRI